MLRISIADSLKLSFDPIKWTIFMEEINKTTPEDIGYAAIKAALGSIPLVGSAASELLGLIVASPLEKRKTMFLSEIGERIITLENEGRFHLEDLSSNPQFLDTVLQATSYALKTSDEEKVKAFKNAIINTALDKAPEKIISEIFLTLTDNFTAWHIRTLHFFNNPAGWFASANRKRPHYNGSSLTVILLHAYPEMQGQRQLVEMVFGDLRRAGLLHQGDLVEPMWGLGLMSSRTTDLGKKFLAFIEAE